MTGQVRVMVDGEWRWVDPPEQREKFTLTVTGEGGQVIRSIEVSEEDFNILAGARTYTTGTGQVLHGVHDPADCEGRPCVIHSPSAHYMADFPTHWRADRGIMERICSHGVGHPDPDDLDFIRHTRGEDDARGEGVHGCDGCCTPQGRRTLMGAPA